MKFDLAGILNFPELPAYIARLDKALEIALKTENPRLQKSIGKLLQVSGKRLRPSLLMAIVVGQNKTIDSKVIQAACAVELLHIASLVHDDIIDGATQRWKIPTINHEEGASQALLVGDYILAQAYSQAAGVSQAVAAAVGTAFAKLCEGQSLELADQYSQTRTVKSYKDAIAGKTAALFAATCEIGGLCADVSNHEQRALAHYGEKFGMAFQLIDDVLDFVSTEKLLGKPVGNDVREGNYTMPLLVSLSAPSGSITIQHLEKNKPASDALIKKLIADGSVQATIQVAKAYNSDAKTDIKKLSDSEGLNTLAHLPESYLQWSLDTLVAPPYKTALGL